MKQARRKALCFVLVGVGMVAAALLGAGHILSLQTLSRTPPTNVVIHVSQLTSGVHVGQDLHPLLEGVEAAERINEEQMRQRRQDWERRKGLLDYGFR